MWTGGVVGGLAVALGGLEANLFCGMHGGLVQTVAQTLHHAHDAKFARGFEHYLEHNFSFDAQVSGFGV